MRSSLCLLAAVLALASAVSAQADPGEYGIKSVAATASTVAAGAHPDFTTSFELKTEKEEGKALPATTSTTSFELPPGLIGNPNAITKCTAAQLVETDPEVKSTETGCPPASQVGIAEVRLFKNGNLAGFTEPIFNMRPGPGEPARFGLYAEVYPVFIRTEVDPGRDYAVTARSEGVGSLIPLLSVNATFWGVPALASHDSQRITAYEAVHGGQPETPTGERPSGLAPVPFMRNPTRCGGADAVRFLATPYALPGFSAEASAPLAANTGCGLVGFKPEASLSVTSSQTQSATGLDLDLTFPQTGLEHLNLRGDSDLQRVEMSLPKGFTVNPSAANGLGACSPADFADEGPVPLPARGCPENSKIGTIAARSPLLEEPVEGALYVATPYENPFDSLLALYMVLRVPDRGVVVKLPGKVTLDPDSGQLTTVFDHVPQLPVADFHLRISAGARASLATPDACGSYGAAMRFSPWAEPGKTVVSTSSISIDRGVNGGPCPGGAPPFKPFFEAGTASNSAAAYSPFGARLARSDGEEELSRFSTRLPSGLEAKLAGVGRCSDQAIAVARGKNGRQELAAPSCPAGSAIGTVWAGGGVGPEPTYVSGKAYLAGPYKGAPLSVVGIVPAVAGPFDIGNVVAREPLRLDPETAEAEVGGLDADPIPRILAGIPLRTRDVRVNVDRPDFTLNPTNCDPLSIGARAWGGLGGTASMSQRFQAANCSRLRFKPRISLELSGATNRGAHPALRAVVRPRNGNANFAAAVVTLPRSEFIENAHFKTICTRVQFAAERCPAGSVYGHAKAITPLLDVPLTGPVYLRSSRHKLPDLVVALKGPPSLPLEVDLASRIDSVNGGIRSSFESIPDVPVTKFILRMQGGDKGLIVNSTNLCKGSHRASAELLAQNSKTFDFKPPLNDSCRGSKGARRQ
jgi:hypothetical protein